MPFAGNTPPSRPVATRAVWASVSLCGVQFVDVMGVTVVVVALPRMLDDLGATASEGTAVVTAYALLFGGLLMVAARVGDRVGPRRTLVGSLAFFAATSAMGALADSVWLLAGARALQGAAAAASVPAALSLLTTVVPAGAARRRAVAGWSAAGAAAGATGFVVGGMLTEMLSWRFAFWMNLPLAAALMAAVLRLIPRDAPRADTRPIGVLPASLLTSGAMLVVSGTSLMQKQARLLPALLVAALGIQVLALFAKVERSTRAPLVPPASRESMSLRWGAVGSFFNTATTTSSITVAALFLQDELEVSPLRASTLLVTVSILAVAGSSAAPGLIGRLGWAGSLAMGLGVVTLGNVVLAGWPQVVGISLAASACGLGLGLASVAANEMGTSVPEAVKGSAAGVLNTAAQLGAALGTAVVLLAATALEPRIAWGLAGLLAALAGLAAGLHAPSTRTAAAR